MKNYHSVSGSAAEDLFIELFSETFGAEKAKYLYSQYHFYDIYQDSRYADFVLEDGGRRIAIEIDDEASHNPRLVSQDKFYDDLLKQNSMVYLGWDVYRWAVRQMQIQPEGVKDELRIFLGSHPQFREIEDYLPAQRGKELDGSQLDLKKHQIEALKSLQAMRDNCETIALLHHAKPAFTLGLTATPERTDDGKIILEIFKNTAHKLDIQTAVEIGELVPIRCIRIHTNINLTKVRLQKCTIQHPGLGKQDLCAGAQPLDRGYLASICAG